MMPADFPTGDRKLIQIMDAALLEAARRSGEWLVCRPGCTQCCIGVFAINQLDAARLRGGLDELSATDPDRAYKIRERARASIARLSSVYPGNPMTGLLDEGDEAEERFEAFGNEEACPALDPASGMCDLYAARPMTCRSFGPPVRSEGGLGVCELCYHGATDEQIAECEMNVPLQEEASVLQELESATGSVGRTTVAFALLRDK